MKSVIITAAQSFLMQALGLTDLSAAQAQATLAPGELYIKTEVTGKGGIVDLIDSSTLRVIGTSSFDKQRLPTGTRMVIERIQFGVAVVPSNDANPPAAQLYSTTYADCPAKLRVAHFILSRGGRKVWEGSVEQLLSLTGTEGINARDNAYPLDEFRLLQGDEELNIQIQFPDNVGWDNTKKVFVSVKLLGPRVQY